jgi:hypothetical protein
MTVAAKHAEAELAEAMTSFLLCIYLEAYLKRR